MSQKNKTTSSSRNEKNSSTILTETPLEFKNVAVANIDFSPLNYRKFFSKTSLNDFASELKLHGIISPLTLRLMSSGRYELVAGERRLRAAVIAGLKEVPATIKTLTDGEAIEIQLAENIQRENPHPMDEACAIGQMQKIRRTIDEIATRLGKSKAFVYGRIKLLSLIEPFQEIFLADKINITEAFEIASVSTESQQEFFDECCSDWKKQKDFQFGDLEYSLSYFKCDLKQAPFNIKDKKLIPEVGACTGCSFNSATLKTLFPEYAKQSVCANKECYQKKCAANSSIQFINAFQEHKPDAFIFMSEPDEIIKGLIQSIEGAAALPQYRKYEISVIRQPELPDKEDYENGDEGEPEFDEEGYGQAMEEYNSELEEYNLLMQSGKALKGLLIGNDQVKMLLYRTDIRTSDDNSEKITAKQVQEAIKTGTATKELLESEIERINFKEERAKQIDRDKIQLLVHKEFTEQFSEVSNNLEFTTADQVAARLLIYQFLDYSTRRSVNETLFPATQDKSDKNESFYDQLAALSNAQYSYLIRMALACKSDSKFPSNDTGKFLYKVAEAAGINVVTIEAAQDQKRIAREEKLQKRISELESKMKKLNKVKVE